MTGFENHNEDEEKTFARGVVNMCLDMGLDMIDDDGDWSVYRLTGGEDESPKDYREVEVDHLEGRAIVSFVEAGENIETREFSIDEGDTVDKVKRHLL